MIQKRDRRAAMNALRCLALAGLTCAAAAAADERSDNALKSPSQQRLGVIVPAHRGDLDRAVSSLGRWPAKCSPVTQKNVDIVLYYAEGEEDTAAAAAMPKIVDSAGRCFADTRLVYANLSEEEDIYPKGPSVQFYKMFLDEDVRAQLVEYDALAIIEWDVLVATDQSFEKLYEAAFDSTEDFWVKGSNLEGTNFHVTAASNDMWHVLGHINGNAIYKNNDSGFTEFVDYTRSRWGYKYPYDVALWATISDFPYSWPLWQRFSPKFVTTNLISNVGYEHVDKGAVADAVASGSLFIHGSMVDEGSVASWRATATTRRSLRVKADERKELACTTACGKVGAGLPVGASTVCDVTCAEGGRFDGYLCGAGSSIKFGAMCRLCFNDVEEARKAESRLKNGKHVIMCDTMRPPAAVDCSDECTIKKDTVCDEACGTGLYGDYNCNWRNLGAKCRSCFDDAEAALEADEVAKRHGGRVIMCDTHEPPNVSVDVKPIAAQSRKLQPWRENQKWKTIEKWQGNDNSEPKWKTSQKWQGNDDTVPKWRRTNKYKTLVCKNGCESDDRICDSSCATGEPYGDLGCNAEDGTYGLFCRTCYNDETEALAADSAENRAIMCATGEPVTQYATRQLRAEASADAPHTARELQPWRENQKWKTIEKWQGNDNSEPKWKTSQKWQGNDDTVPKWRRTNKYKTLVCKNGCESDDRICDSSCETGEPYGDLGCNAEDGTYGLFCRACYNDETEALAADSAENRAIMCATGEPVTQYATRQLRAEASADAPHTARELQPWRENQKWKTIEKWQGNDNSEPKWKTSQKWQGNDDTVPKWRRTNKYKTLVCKNGCESDDRICDSSCATGEPYGDLGCNAEDGTYGLFCRTCYNDETEALAADSAENRAIMCATGEPVTQYATRQLRAEASADAPHTARELQPWRENQKWKTIEKWQGNDNSEPKWKTSQKWQGNDDTVPKWRRTNKYKTLVCKNGCESDDRICDSSCATGEPYGDLGCNAEDGTYGLFCRICYNDETEALAADSAENRAIMCATGEPVTQYATRQLRAEASADAPHTARELQPWRENQKWKTIEKWQGNDNSEPKWKTSQKWQGNDDTVPKWRRTNKYKTLVCKNGCESDDRICDSSCATGEPYGDLGCNAEDGTYGLFCRACYNDETEALAADSAENRAIMCATGEPVTQYATRQLRAEASADAPHTARELQPWRENQKWKTIEKWQGNDNSEPKWKTSQKWQGNDDTVPKWRRTNKYKTLVCKNGCESDDRICDSSCETGEPYGDLGCNAEDGTYGLFCRTCYNDENEALAADSAENRAIMCATGEPVTQYATRQLRAVDNTFDPATETPSFDLEAFISVSANTSLTNDIVRGDICAFISGGMNEVEQADVTAQSILEFVPGVRVVIAAEAGSKPAYESAAGLYPSVSVFDASSARTASLFADEYCGEGTKLIFYVETGSVISRTFTSKDTHSPRGDLLVVYSDARTSYRDFEIARATSAVLGFKAPSFTHGADLMLPVGANKDLREELTMGIDSGLTDKDAAALAALESYDVSSVPQLLAALAYSKSTPGVWFVNPQAWVTEHLFKTASIWDVPLVKPRFTCTIERSLYSSQASAENAELLTKNLDFFQKGGLCENGVIFANP